MNKFSLLKIKIYIFLYIIIYIYKLIPQVFFLNKNEILILTLQRQGSAHGSSLMLPIRLQLQRKQFG